jgi:hypothetical protein
MILIGPRHQRLSLAPRRKYLPSISFIIGIQKGAKTFFRLSSLTILACCCGS